MSTFQYLEPKNLVETFRTSQSYTEGLTEHFREYERLARNKPHASIPKEYPKTTDGTTASIIRKTPHRIIQQLPTGKVKSTTEDWLSIVAEFIYTEKIIPNANESYALLQKCWNVVERFLTFGSCPTYAPFVEHAGYFCPDLRLPYWGDIFLQPGKLSDEDSNYIFLRSWWQTKDIDALIERQSKLPKNKRTWDVDALEHVKDITVTKDDKTKTPAEIELQVNSEGGVELITGFQRGKKAKFYTFHVQSTGSGEDKKYNGTVVRTKVNKDPRGELPISFAYGDIDGTNPLGRSIIDLVGGLQNLMDGEMQMYQYNRALQLNPPLLKWGNFSKNKIKFAPNVIIDLGTNPDAKIEPLTIDTTALANFPNNYGLMKSQMLNLLASPDTSISAEVGNPGFSKTPQGVEASKANLSIDDNYVRKQFETWFERWSETAINLYFAERTGVEELQLNQESADELRELATEGKFDPNLLSDDNKIRIDYDTATPALKFEVDASTSKMKEEIQELESLQGLAQFLDKSDQIQALVPPQKKLQLWNAIVSNSGTENPEKLKMNEKEIEEAIKAMADQDPPPRENLITNYKDLPEDIKRQQEANLGFQPSQLSSPTMEQTELKAAQLQQQEQGKQADLQMKAQDQEYQQGMGVAQFAQSGEKQQHDMKMSEQKPTEGKTSKSKPKAEPKQPQLSEEDKQLIQILQQLQIPDQQIGQALAMLHNGYPVEEILQMLGVGNG